MVLVPPLWHRRGLAYDAPMAHSLAYERTAAEGAAHEPHVALGHPESVADVAGAVAVHVARGRLAEWRHAAPPQTHIELRHHECIADVHDSISVHIAAGDRNRFLHGADVARRSLRTGDAPLVRVRRRAPLRGVERRAASKGRRSEEHTSELQSRENLVCRL